METEDLIKAVRARGYFVTECENRYDRKDMVRQVAMLRASPLKIAAYQVRDPETLEWSKTQFHMTFDNCVMGMLEAESAKLFARFITEQLGREEVVSGPQTEAVKTIAQAGD